MRAQEAGRVDVEPELREHGGPGSRIRRWMTARATGLPAQRDVLRDREVGQQVDLLVDRGDPGPLCVVRRRGRDLEGDISPVANGSAPVMALIRVDLPAPFSPMSEWTSPGKTRKSTWSSAASAPKCTVAPVSSRSGCAAARRAGAGSAAAGLSSALRSGDDHTLHHDEEQQQRPTVICVQACSAPMNEMMVLIVPYTNTPTMRAEDVAAAAAQQRAADDDRGDHVELGADAVAGVAGARVGGEDQTGESAAEPADDVGRAPWCGPPRAPSGGPTARCRRSRRRCVRSGCRRRTKAPTRHGPGPGCRSG